MKSCEEKMNGTLSENLLKLPPLQLESFDDLQKVFRELSESFQKAENNIIVVRDRYNKFPIPAINQLRYAGYHMAQALASIDASGLPISINHAHLIASHKHCLRAYYDAFDFAVVVTQNVYEKARDAYNGALISIYKEFPDILKLEEEIYDMVNIKKLESEDFIEDAVQTSTQRTCYYKLLNEKLEKIFDLYKIMPMITNHLSIKIKQQKAIEEKRQAKKEEQDRNDRIAKEEQDRKDRLAKEDSDRKDKRNYRVAFISMVVASIIALGVVAFDADLKKVGPIVKEYFGISANADEVKVNNSNSTSLSPVQ